jgi:phi13 family phage major tail protein
MEKESVRIGVDQLYYAKITADTVAALTYGAPVPLKGLNEVVVTRNSTKLIHYSDNMPSELIPQDGETTVQVNLDGLSSAVKADILGTTYSASTGLYQEGNGEVAPYIALGYRSKKGNGFYKYTWFLKGQISKANATDQTIGATVPVQTSQHVFTAIKPIYYANSKFGIKNSYQSDDANAPSGLTDALLIVPETGFFSSPLYVPAAPGTAIADLAGTAGAGAAGTIALTFGAPTGCTGAFVQVKDPMSSIWINAATVAAITAASTTATITGLTASNKYDVRLVVQGGTKNGISNTAANVAAHA